MTSQSPAPPEIRWNRRPTWQTTIASLIWAGALLVLWLPAAGSVAVACRPWRFTKHQFGFFGYYRTQVAQNGAWLEGIDPTGLRDTVLMTVIVSAIFACRLGWITMQARPELFPALGRIRDWTEAKGWRHRAAPKPTRPSGPIESRLQ